MIILNKKVFKKYFKSKFLLEKKKKKERERT